ncbi:MAG: response regulator transcription factor [Pseudoclavibacter sp.]
MPSQPDRPTRVVIIDDHDLVSIAIGEVIRGYEGLDVVGRAHTVAEFRRLGVAADVAVLDLALGDDSDPADNVRRIAETGANVMVLTSGENPYLIRRVSRANVFGIVRKSAPSHEIADAIARAARGEHVLTTEWAAALDGDEELRGAPLTAREREVLRLYASGLGAKMVASRLSVSENTVDDHLRRIRRVYRDIERPADTKVELYQRGLEDGYIPPPAAR